MLKRAFDVFGAAAGVIACAPLLVVIAALICVRHGRPVFFLQSRPGVSGKPFRLIKFRTMTNARDATGQPLPDAERLTPLGRCLRSSSLDELPELWNVLRGDMSLVGPRPLLMQYMPLYTAQQARRHEIRPGITGLAQVSGRNALNWEEKFALDVWYVDNKSFLLDLKILALTVWSVVARRGINQPGHATMPEFGGSRMPPDNGPVA